MRFFFFFKQKTAYEVGTGDWSSDVCSSDLKPGALPLRKPGSIKSGALLQREMGSIKSGALPQQEMGKIGRASCRERV